MMKTKNLLSTLLLFLAALFGLSHQVAPSEISDAIKECQKTFNTADYTQDNLQYTVNFTSDEVTDYKFRFTVTASDSPTRTEDGLCEGMMTFTKCNSDEGDDQSPLTVCGKETIQFDCAASQVGVRFDIKSKVSFRYTLTDRLKEYVASSESQNTLYTSPITSQLEYPSNNELALREDSAIFKSSELLYICVTSLLSGEDNLSKCRDSLTFYDGPNDTFPVLAYSCGAATQAFWSSGQEVYMVFNTYYDSPERHGNFSVSYRELNATVTAKEDEETNVFLPSFGDKVHQGKGNVSDMSFELDIQFETPKEINVSSLGLPERDESGACQGGITLYDGPDASSPVITTVCGSERLFFWSYGHHLFVVYKGSSDSSEVYALPSLDLRDLDTVIDIATDEPVNLKIPQCGPFFESTLQDANETSVSVTGKLEYTLRAGQDSRIDIVTHIDASEKMDAIANQPCGGMITFYDGCDSGAPAVLSACRTDRTKIWSSTNCLRIVHEMQVDSGLQVDVFIGAFSFEDDEFISVTKQYNSQQLSRHDYQFQFGHIVSVAPNTSAVTNSNARMVRKLTFENADKLKQIHIHIPFAQLPGRLSSGECGDSKVTFYNGPSEHSPILAIFCGMETPHVWSSGNHILMVLQASAHAPFSQFTVGVMTLETDDEFILEEDEHVYHMSAPSYGGVISGDVPHRDYTITLTASKPNHVVEVHAYGLNMPNRNQAGECSDTLVFRNGPSLHGSVLNVLCGNETAIMHGSEKSLSMQYSVNFHHRQHYNGVQYTAVMKRSSASLTCYNLNVMFVTVLMAVFVAMHPSP